MFSLTNNPIIDTGIHVMEAWLKKRCDEIDEKDLKKIKKDIIKRYLRKDMQSHLSTIFSNNCAWCQPAYAGKPEKRVEEAGPLFDKINAPPLQPIRRCNSCSRDAVFELNRMYYPMMAGEDIFIYLPEGSSGIPICGECLFAKDESINSGRPRFYF